MFHRKSHFADRASSERVSRELFSSRCRSHRVISSPPVQTGASVSFHAFFRSTAVVNRRDATLRGFVPTSRRALGKENVFAEPPTDRKLKISNRPKFAGSRSRERKLVHTRRTSVFFVLPCAVNRRKTTENLELRERSPIDPGHRSNIVLLWNRART